MTPPRVSVVIVSRGRPQALARALVGLWQQVAPAFEIVVVADPAGLNAVAPRQGQIVTCGFDEANISAARNIGLMAAGGSIVAFLDDDAVPEPTWLVRLVAPFSDPAVAATGGLVLGRNGITPQWRFRKIRADGTTPAMPALGGGPLVVPGGAGEAAKTEGTNMAFRAALLREVGGFDPAYRFYLDETDLNLRLAAAGWATALVPGAVVHHGFAESDRRRADRVPHSLFEVGASLAVFARRHGGGEGLLPRERAERRRGLLAHMVAGRIEPRDVARLLATLDAGWAAGQARPLAPLGPLDPLAEGAPWRPAARGPDLGPVTHVAARWQARAIRALARREAQQGYRPSLVLLHPGFQPHRVRFDPAGFWEQTGGLWGRADRAVPGATAGGLAARGQAELARVADLRGLG